MESVTTKLRRIAEMARRDSGFVFTNLMHLVDESFLWEAYHRIRKDGAAGVDGVTGKEYAVDLGRNIKGLYGRLRSGRYKAPPVKRRWVPKDDQSERPIGIPAFEDKIVQKAVAMLLEAVYEASFHGHSYAFRPGRNPHQALEALREQCYRAGVSEVIDADIQGYFDAIEHRGMVKILKKRVNDGSLLRLVNIWLRAGVMDGEQLSYPDSGSPQGGVISPVLSNIYLDEVLDSWYEQTVKPVMYGRTFLVRYADDFILGFENAEDARRLMAVLPKRFAKYGLRIHPEKTRRLDFRRPGRGLRKCSADSFDFLGFTHYWGRSLKGHWAIKRRTCRKKLNTKLKGLTQWCRENMHEPLKEQWQTLRKKLAGHYQYYGIIGNYKQMEVYYEHAIDRWRKSLNRRSSKGQRSYERFKENILKSFPLPAPRIMHQV